MKQLFNSVVQNTYVAMPYAIAFAVCMFIQAVLYKVGYPHWSAAVATAGAGLYITAP